MLNLRLRVSNGNQPVQAGNFLPCHPHIHQNDRAHAVCLKDKYELVDIWKRNRFYSKARCYLINLTLPGLRLFGLGVRGRRFFRACPCLALSRTSKRRTWESCGTELTIHCKKNFSHLDQRLQIFCIPSKFLGSERLPRVAPRQTNGSQILNKRHYQILH